MTNEQKDPFDELMDTLILESEVEAFILRINRFDKHIRDVLPDALFLLPDGTPNVRTRWGAVLHHLGMARASVRGHLR
jgi:hypothetical protein